MRSKYAALNAIFAMLCQITNALINFIIRRVLVSVVGIEYLGINGLFSNILQLLCLVESGFGTAIVYLLYKPIALNDEKQISRLMNYYSKIYRVVAGSILCIGICFIPFLGVMIKDNPFGEREIIVFYLLFLANTVSSYFLAYKSSFLNAYQRQFYVSIISILVNIIFAVVKVISLLALHNYVVYLIMIILNTLSINLFVSIVAGKKFSFLKINRNLELDTETKRRIRKDVKSLLYHKLGGYVLNGTDNIVITYFAGLVSVGLYSNYYLIFSTVNLLVSQVFNAIVPGLGQVIAEDSVKAANRIYLVYKTTYYLNFLLYGCCAVLLTGLIQPFMMIWLGESCYTLSNSIVFLMVINFYFGGMRSAPNAVKSAAGIYRQDRFSPICEAIINIIVSVILAKRIGLSGVIMGTIISCLSMPFWTAPFFVYRNLFKKKFSEYILDSIKYLFITVAGCLAIYYIMHFFPHEDNVLLFIFRCFICVLTTVLYFFVVFICSKERSILMTYFSPVIKRIYSLANRK